MNKIRSELWIARAVKCGITGKYYHQPYARSKAGEIELRSFMEAGIIPREGEELLFYDSMHTANEVRITSLSYKYTGASDERTPVVLFIGVESVPEQEKRFLFCPVGCSKCGDTYEQQEEFKKNAKSLGQ